MWEPVAAAAAAAAALEVVRFGRCLPGAVSHATHRMLEVSWLPAGGAAVEAGAWWSRLVGQRLSLAPCGH